MRLPLFVVGALLQHALAGDVGDVVPNLRQCHEDLIYPTGSTCCPSGCAPGMFATCCSDRTACPNGYACVSGRGCQLEQDSSDDSSDDEDDDRPHTTARLKLCSPDNSWEHGLDSGGKTVAYKDNIMAQLAGNIKALALRYAARDVTYVIGELDTDHIAWEEDIDDRSPEWAGSNQGLTRYDRLELYYESLTEVMGGKKVHRMLVGAGVGHDGPRMQTNSGYEAVFGNSRFCINPSSNTADS